MKKSAARENQDTANIKKSSARPVKPAAVPGHSPLVPVVGDLKDRLRGWRKDAWEKSLWSTAAYWGDKVLTMEGDARDYFWQAKIYVAMNEFARAEHMFRGRRELIETNMPCRYMAALCATKQDKWEEAAALVDESVYPIDGDVAAADANMRSAMLYLMGTIVNHCGEASRAPDYMKRAVKEDPRCVEAWEWLMKTRLITSSEAQDFLRNLDYSICGQDAEFVRLLYQSRAGPFEEAQLKELETTYKLAGNHDVLFRRAEALFAQCRFSECIEITTAVHQRDPYHDSIVPMHASCLSELGNRNELFYFAHQISQHFPERPSSWFAVGAYYLMLGKNLDARKYFTKCTIMDSSFGPGWLGFAHSFAAEAETDQAISAYATAVKLFDGMHAPLMHLGILYLQLENLRLAQEYLSRAEEMIKTDPLLTNEVGVLHVKLGKPIDGVVCFNRALSLANEGSLPTITWETTRYNLAHAHRKLGNYEAAQRVLEQIIELNQDAVEAHTSLGWISLRLDNPQEAAMHLQTALSLDPNSETAQDLLKLSMEQLTTMSKNKVQAANSTSVHCPIRDDYFLPSDLERHRVLRDPTPCADLEQCISNGHIDGFRDRVRSAAPEHTPAPHRTPFAINRHDTESANRPTIHGEGSTPTFAYTLRRASSALVPAFPSPPIRPRRHPAPVALGDNIGVRTPSEQSFNFEPALPRANDFAARLIRPPGTPATPSDANISFEMDMDVEDD
ncbi:anaphase promoting complex subunit cdc16 [Geranomyces variabilis]|nr:anaphase promoting complex subunit cdc16 [Geranomyces variabilis]